MQKFVDVSSWSVSDSVKGQRYLNDEHLDLRKSVARGGTQGHVHDVNWPSICGLA